MAELKCINYIKINDREYSESELGEKRFREIMEQIATRGMEAIGFRRKGKK